MARMPSAQAWLQIAGVGFAATVVFAAALPNGWLGDDRSLLVDRLTGVTWTSLPGLLGETYWGALHPTGGLYRPTALMLLGVQRLMFGLDLTSYRLVTIGLHTIASVLVLWLLRKLDDRGALAGALLFALHPIHAEAVTTVYGQQDVAAGVLALMALHSYLAARSATTVVMPALTAGLYFLSMTCKEQVVLLPCLFWAWQRPCGDLPPKQSWWVRPGPWIGLAFVLYAALRAHALSTSFIPVGEATVAAGYPWWARGTLVVTTLGTYVRLLFLPWGQTTYYGHLRHSIFGVPTLELVVLCLAISGLAVAWRRTRDQTIQTAGAVLAVFLLPVANIVPIGTVVAERCLYLPVLAVSLLVATTWRQCKDLVPRAVVAITIVVLLVCGASAVSVALRWRTPLTHWRATVADHPAIPEGARDRWRFSSWRTSSAIQNTPIACSG